MAQVVKECTRISGHPDLVPCRICTALVPRSCLGGALPEETHHDADTLREFFNDEKRRRDDIAEQVNKELQAWRNGSAARSSKVKKNARANVKKKPAAAAVQQMGNKLRKKPAAAPMKRNGTGKVRKKPARA